MGVSFSLSFSCFLFFFNWEIKIRIEEKVTFRQQWVKHRKQTSEIFTRSEHIWHIWEKAEGREMKTVFVISSQFWMACIVQSMLGLWESTSCTPQEMRSHRRVFSRTVSRYPERCWKGPSNCCVVKRLCKGVGGGGGRMEVEIGDYHNNLGDQE